MLAETDSSSPVADMPLAPETAPLFSSPAVKSVVQARRILVTGAAGFIGFHTSRRLLERGDTVIGLDNLNNYYDPKIKEARLDILEKYPNFSFVKVDLADNSGMADLFRNGAIDRVVHLGAQAGVRYSMENPHAYVQSNIVGTTNILEGCRHGKVQHLVYASTSSVYGSHTDMPFTPHRSTEHPMSFYAATKKANEMMAHTYSNLFGLPTTGLRFFTVYGPWGRPDMALFLFTKSILAGEPIKVFNNGHHKRDFTYVEDIVSGIVGALDQPAAANPAWSSDTPDPATSNVPYRIFNIGNNQCVPLLRYIELLEECLDKKARMNMLPLQAGDVPDTWADITDLQTAVGYSPKTPVEVGVRKFVEWYREYYKV